MRAAAGFLASVCSADVLYGDRSDSGLGQDRPESQVCPTLRPLHILPQIFVGVGAQRRSRTVRPNSINLTDYEQALVADIFHVFAAPGPNGVTSFPAVIAFDLKLPATPISAYHDVS
jgi:hypothetical protein